MSNNPIKKYVDGQYTAQYLVIISNLAMIIAEMRISGINTTDE